MARTSLALAPSQQSTIYAMAASQDTSSPYYNGLLAVYRSTANGDAGSWQTQVANTDPDLLNTLLLSQLACPGTAFTIDSQGWYDNVLAVDPLDPNRLWAGGVGTFRSDDGGATWGLAAGTHPDNHIFVFDRNYDGVANQTMYLGNDGGLYRTDTARAPVSTGASGACYTNYLNNSGVVWIDLNDSYGATQYYHGAVYPGGQAYFGGSQDNGTSRGSDAFGPNNWQQIGGGDGASVAIDPADANAIIESAEQLSLLRSANGGATFSSATAGITEPADNFPFISYLAADPNEGHRLYLGGATNLWRSIDGAATWTAAAPVESQSSVGAVAVSPTDPNTVIFGTALGYIYRSATALSTTGSQTWASTFPRSGYVQSIAFDPTNTNVVYATYSTYGDAHVYKSSDGGASWVPSDGSGNSALPDIPAFRLLVDPKNPSMLYLGTDLGVFVSADGGGSWAIDPNDFANVVVEELALDRDANWLTAFSYGRSAWRVALPSAAAPNCTYMVSPGVITADAVGGIYPVTVSTADGCSWAALPGRQNNTFATVQSPAMGTGAGTAFVVAGPNFSGNPLSDTLSIAGNGVSITQPNPTFQPPSEEPAAAAPVSGPFLAIVNPQLFTGNADGPVHSCTNSADFENAWWQIKPATSGVLLAQVTSNRYDVYGNAGVVITAYAQTAPTVELGCAVVPRDTGKNGVIPASISFNVQVGMTYLIEVSATVSGSQGGGDEELAVTMQQPSASVSVLPSSVQLSAGGANQQFTATVANAQNTAVRWSLAPPVGSLTRAGLYTPPAGVDGPTTVTITAASFADPPVPRPMG
jgi:hypothetical protein